MRLEHYAAQPFRHPLVGTRDQASGLKPRGLWVTDMDCETNWLSWCRGGNWNLEGVRYRHEVILRQDHNILMLTSEIEIKRLTRDYALDPIRSAGARVDLTQRRPGMFRDIDWPRLARLYDGILITPYIWSCRLDPETFWYYGWDCASGCIWNPQAIESISLGELTQ